MCQQRLRLQLRDFRHHTPEVFRQIIETNLFGTVHTARAVLPYFQSQGRGTLIPIGSVYSKITSPYVSPYVTSKFGLLGFTEVLRQELRKAKKSTSASSCPQRSTRPSTSTLQTTPDNRSIRFRRWCPRTVSPRRSCEIRDGRGR